MLRRPRRVQRRNIRCAGRVLQYSFGPLNAGWRSAPTARHPCQHGERSKVAVEPVFATLAGSPTMATRGVKEAEGKTLNI